jgi:GNAT superfamily N-acetyltransferase
MATAKERKAKLKAETEQRNARAAKLSFANDNLDNLSDLPIFREFNRSGISGANTYYQHCPAELKDWVLDLTERNVRAFHEETSGWNPNEKRGELFDDSTRFNILSAADRTIGFAGYRFEAEMEALRIFIIGLQIEPEFQGKGLGKFLLQSLEFIGLKQGMEYVMVSVLHAQQQANGFFKKSRYVPHPLSPSIADPGNPRYDYEILHKSLVKKTASYFPHGSILPHSDRNTHRAGTSAMTEHGKPFSAVDLGNWREHGRGSTNKMRHIPLVGHPFHKHSFFPDLQTSL